MTGGDYFTLTYELNEKEQVKFLKETQSNIENGHNELLIKMNTIVKRSVKSYLSDFFVHDLYVLNEREENFLWLVRDFGTNLIQLDDPEFYKGHWKWMDWYKAIKHTMKTKAFYYIDESIS
ncbi:hypothetical protein HV417_18500 [Bacillus sporothermodurans]|uniref:hypothetical protein n=1 Tax=Heyndrickxia sporothermodurans TaxID=46224 RepID=UPI00192ACE41|nr:hypothetical protein [Heyndrickxia sporothermodurans]MBL5875412.1 hypothetical protein [Heyndrickxia sporothermodurans]